MYEIFEKLCKEKGVTAYKVAQCTGLSRTTFTNWRKNEYTLKQSTLQKIADYFDVTLDYLMYGCEKEEKFSEENAKLIAQIRNDKSLSQALLKYFDLSTEKKRHVVELINLLSE